MATRRILSQSEAIESDDRPEGRKHPRGDDQKEMEREQAEKPQHRGEIRGSGCDELAILASAGRPRDPSKKKKSEAACC